MSTTRRVIAAAVGAISVLAIHCATAAPVNAVSTLGGAGDGIADDTAALESWLSSVPAYGSAIARPGTFRYTRPLRVIKNGVALKGSGPYQTILMYDGLSNTNDLLYIGSNNNKLQLENIAISGMRITSKTKMIKGAGLHLENVVRSELDNVTIDGQDGLGNLWNGIWFDKVDAVRYHGFDISAKNDGLEVNGASVGAKADLFVTDGKISGCQTGIHVGGAFGGLFLNQADVISNTHSMRIDTDIAHEGNRELFVGSTVAFDSSTGDSDVVLADTMANAGALLQFTGTWLASGRGCGIEIQKGANWIVSLTGGTIFNYGGNGVCNHSPSSRLFVNGPIIRNNAGAGIASVQDKDRLSNGVYANNRGGIFVKLAQ